MPLKKFFDEQIQSLQAFLDNPGQTVRCLTLETGLKKIFCRVLAGVEGKPEFLHSIVAIQVPFRSADQYYGDLFTDVAGEFSELADDFKLHGFDCEALAREFRQLPPRRRFAAYIAAVGDRIVAHAQGSSLVLILDPPEVAAPQEFAAAMEFLAEHTETRWVKYVVFDNREKPLLTELPARTERAWNQTFHITPEAIEANLRERLKKPEALSADERRQHLAMLAGFASAKKEYAEAEQHQKEWLRLTERDGVPAEAANAYYNLGNTHLAAQNYAEAEASFGRAIELAVDHQVTGLLPLALVNFGVALERQKRLEQAARSLQIACDTCRAQDNLPTEYHALTCLAKTHVSAKNPAAAAPCWQAALDVHDRMVVAGIVGGPDEEKDQIVRDLEAHYRKTNQADKLRQLHARKAG